MVQHLPRLRRFVRYGFVLFLLPLSVLPAAATLGEDVASIDSDKQNLKAAVQIVPGQFYSIHQMRTASGTTIRQFVSPAGIVFAVSWEGLAPNLEQLLGSYFSEYLRESSVPGRRGRGVHLDTGDFVLDCGGHMRFVVGRALVRSKLPSGAKESDIQ